MPDSAAQPIPTAPDTLPSSPTRRELYELVWSYPLSGLAAQWGISRNGLAKICDRLLVPYPGRGFWTKAEQRRQARPALPSPPSDTVDPIAIAQERPRSRRPRTRLAPEQRRDQLLDAAARIISEEGLHAATTKGVARRVGLSEAQAHNYFPHRSDLLVALARRELAAMDTKRMSEVERGHDNLTRVTLSTITYLRQVAVRGALIQTLLNSPEVRAGLRAEREVQARSGAGRMIERLNARYGVPSDVAHGATVILTAVCLRAGRLLAEGKIDLELAERLSLAIVTAGNRSLVRHARPGGAG